MLVRGKSLTGGEEDFGAKCLGLAGSCRLTWATPRRVEGGRAWAATARAERRDSHSTNSQILTYRCDALKLDVTHQGREAGMNGQRIGYARVSTLDQNERRQLEGQVLDRLFSTDIWNENGQFRPSARKDHVGLGADHDGTGDGQCYFSALAAPPRLAHLATVCGVHFRRSGNLFHPASPLQCQFTRDYPGNSRRRYLRCALDRLRRDTLGRPRNRSGSGKLKPPKN